MQSPRNFLALLLLGMLATAPLAAAGPVPAIYFFADASTPLEDGELSAAAPTAEDTGAARVILPGTAEVPSAAFVFQDGEHADRLAGRSLVGAWPGPDAVLDGVLTGVLYDQAADGSRTVIATASQDLSLDPSQVPDPTTLIPPDPTDPEGAVYYLAGQLLPYVYQPPILLDFGVLDHTLEEGHTIAVGFFLDASTLPVGVGAATLLYDTALTPSFLYVPWYEEPVPSSTSSSSSSSTTSSSSTSGSSSSTSSGAPTLGGNDEGGSKQSPGLAVPLLLAGLVGVALVRRRLA